MAERIEAFAARLSDPAADDKAKVNHAIEIRDNIDLLCSGALYPIFLRRMLPVFTKILDEPPVFMSASWKHWLRNTVLETIHRLPMTPADIIRPCLSDLVDLLMKLVRIENEDNAVLCMKTIMDFQRAHPDLLASKVQPFLELIKEVFEGMTQAVRDTFDTPGQGATPSGTNGTPQTFGSPRPGSPTASNTLDMGIEPQAPRLLARGMQSFKVLAECPIIVVSLLQAQKAAVQQHVRDFVPLIKSVLLAEAKPQRQAHEEAAKQGTIFFGISKDIKSPAAFGDFITAQVKTMSFLAYLLRAYTKQLEDFLQILPDICIRMLQDCPSEKSAARKELLVAIRLIINFNYKGIFGSKVKDLLDERTLLGDGLTVYETMRPLAYSMLADLIHHVRDTLDATQLRRIIDLFTRNMLEDFPGTSFQTMSAKLLLGLVDRISNLPNREDGRYYLLLILRAIADKFAAMNREYPNALKLSKLHEKHSLSIVAENHLVDPDKPPDWDETDIFHATPIKTSIPREASVNPIEDNKYLFENLMTGLKALFYRLRNTNPDRPEIDPLQAPPNWHDIAFGFKAEEVDVITRLFHEGAQVFRYYNLEQPPSDMQYASPIEYWANFYMIQSSKEERKLLETFATVFHCIDPATFYEVFQAEIPRLAELVFEHTALLHIPQFFLASEATSPSFAGMLLQYLMDHLEDVGLSDIKRSSILLRMFKLSFMAVTLFSNQNEQVLLPHITKLITRAIELSTTAPEPMNYFYLLRSLFRSIGGGRFELLYKEILPLLEMLLDVLNNLLQAARKPQERHLYVELCLTVPARLSNLLPLLSYLMRPLVVALRADNDLVGQGLRTLELCVDNLTADYLDPIMAPVIDDLMQALWDHLRPAPYSHFHAHTTMRILGKLGGRNRKFLTSAPPLTFRSYADDEPSFDVRLIGSSKDRAFPTRVGIDLAMARLRDPPKPSSPNKKASDFYKQQAFRMVAAQIKMHLGAETLPDDLMSLVRLQANDLVDRNYSHALDLMDRSDRDKSIPKKESQEETVKKLLKACMAAVQVPELKLAATALLHDVCRHFAIIDLGMAMAVAKHRQKPFNPQAGEGPLCIDSRCLADAIAETLASDEPDLRAAAEDTAKMMFNCSTAIFGSVEKASHLPFFHQLAKTFCHNCYEEAWYTKAGGAFGIDILNSKLALGDAWMNERQVDFVRALIFLIKDIPADLPIRTRAHAFETLKSILKRCNRDATKEDLANHHSKVYQVCAHVSLELSHMNKHVREAARSSLIILGECLGVEIYEIIEPVKERILQPIYNKPLRALVFQVQIGYIEAVIYCLRLEHGIVESNDQLNRLILETLALTDADDEAISVKPHEYRTAEQLIALRVACIQLLSTALLLPEFSSEHQPQTGRNRIISVFFKSLYSSSSTVIDAAYEGLKGVLSQSNKLPKDLLHNGLRPILMTLQDHKKINVQTLEVLARLLALLTYYFKVEIGDRLINHMEILSQDPSLQRTSFSLIEQSPQTKIVTATLNIFHLLPPTAVSMLPRLIYRVMDLEDKLRRTQRSPFRAPLFKYLCRYPKETWEFFAPRMEDIRFGRFFAQALASPSCEKLRDYLMTTPDVFINTFFQPADQLSSVRVINGINIAHSICRYKSEWLLASEPARNALMHAGRSIAASQKLGQIEPALRLPALVAAEQLMDASCWHMAATPSDSNFLFSLIDQVTTGQLSMQTSFKHFLYTNVISNDSIAYWRALILRCIDLCGTRGTPSPTKTFLLHNLINPILAMDVMRQFGNNKEAGEDKLADKVLMDAIHNKLWRPQFGGTGTESSQSGIVDHSPVELLQMSAFILKYHHGLVNDTRKDIIKFGWIYIRSDDVIYKHAAYVLIAFFIALFDTPSKIANQIYGGLLRAHQNEARALVVQALDLIAPVLSKRLQPSGDPNFLTLAKLPKRLLADEGSNLQQVNSILGFLSRHAELFYEARGHFLPLIIPALPKMATLPTASNENKRSVLNVIDMIRKWEEWRITGRRPATASASRPQSPELQKNAASSERRMSLDTNKDERPPYQIPAPLRLTVIKYLAQFISTMPERFPTQAKCSESSPPTPATIPMEICKTAFGLMSDLLSPDYWADLDIELFPRLFESILASDRTEKAFAAEHSEKPDERTISYITNTLRLMRIILSAKPAEWIQSQISFIRKLLEKSLKSETPEVQECLHGGQDEEMGIHNRKTKPLLQLILDAIPLETPEDEDMEVETPSTEFITWLSTVTNETLSNNNFVAGLDLLWTLAQVKPELVDPQIPNVMRALQQKLAKDHVNNAAAANQPGGAPVPRPGEPGIVPQDPRESELTTELILKAIDILSMRMGALGENRRPFLSTLALLVEKSFDVRLCEKILGMVEAWIFDSTDAWPTLKEKTAVLHKMLNFEARPDPTLLHKFLDLVIRIYDDPKITRTELTVRLEHAFLVGTRAQDVTMRDRFMSIFDRSLTRTASARLLYVLTSQNWDTLAETFWLSQAIQLILGSVDMGTVAALDAQDFRTMPISQLYGYDDPRKGSLMLDETYEDFMEQHRRFTASLAEVKVKEILEPLGELQHTDSDTAMDIWVTLFPLCWSALVRDDRVELEKGLVSLLTKDYHQRQIDRRPNVVQALVEGIVRARPRVKLPPHVLKFMSKTYDVWYPAMVSMEENVIAPVIDTPALRESTLDALVETYAGLQEDDLYYGTWRRRCRFVETNAALSYEQNGMWDKAQSFYEAAQLKARTGVVPFSQAEYMLWEDHWALCAQKLQQWDVLSDYAKHENFNDLLLEASYRNYDLWAGTENLDGINSIIKAVSDAPTPRRNFFQAFMSLLRYHDKTESGGDFNRICDEATQLSIRKWHQLPKRITNAHISILQGFQQLVELSDAQMIFQSLHQTTVANLDAKSQELKLLLGTWRDRLPNVWDDINAWQSLVTWRQHIFQQINKTYLGLAHSGPGGGNNNSLAYRGYHETAWIINRFARVARKHSLLEVCHSQLSKIYTLPNIEIQEAFLKLREQAKCHYQSNSELTNGLDVINNTNLQYFNNQQKAEFYTLKGMFLAKLKDMDNANSAFGSALSFDIHSPKAWEEWGYYNDMMLKTDPDNIERAASALSCYLEAASQYKSAKARKLLGRILWLLSIDNPERRITRAFEEFKGEWPTWYWITFIPQLCTSLSQPEAHIARELLVRIAKTYPQALYFHIRTQREDMLAIKRQTESKMASNQPKPEPPKIKPEADGSEAAKGASSTPSANGDTAMANGTPNGTAAGGSSSPKREVDGFTANGNNEPTNGSESENLQSKKPWEHSEDIMQILKTAFPLLALSMETMIDQIQKHFKCPPDEDAYRLIVALLNDGLAYIGRMPHAYAHDFKLPPGTEVNIRKFAETILPPPLRGSFEQDFVVKRPTMYEYVHKLRRWRDKFEEKLDRRPAHANLETSSPHLSEFRFQKFDDVEIPGQYLQLRDKNTDFVKIDRFLPHVDLVRTIGFSHRRLHMRGSDGSAHAFAVQHPAARQCRREERTIQLFRLFNGALSKSKEARRRNLNFTLPVMVALAPSLRLVEEDAQYISLQGVYEDHCRRHGLNKDEPVLFTMEKLRSMADGRNNKYPDQAQNLRMEALRAVQERWVPNNVALEYFQKTYPNLADFWLFRRQFSYQLAALTFMTFIMHMTSRYPHKLSIARNTGNIWGSELIASISSRGLFHNPEPVPFRLTPNLQALMGPIATEGIFACAIMAIARSLTEPEFELEQQLCIFVRDEVHFWYLAQHRSLDAQVRERVQQNCDLVVKKALALARSAQGTLPAHQTIIDTISAAVDPMRLAQCDALWMPYL